MTFGVQLAGNLVAGVNYNESDLLWNKPETFSYSKHFSVDSIGPMTKGDSKLFKLHASISLYLILENVGSVHITLQPHIDVTEDTNNKHDECESYLASCKSSFVISPQLHIFVGAKIQPLNWIKLLEIKDTEIYHQPIIPSHGKTVKKLGKYQCLLWGDQLKSALNGTDINYSQRRRLASSQSNKDPIQFTQISYNYASLQTVWHGDMKWGQNFTIWRANLSLLEESCPERFNKTRQTSPSPILTSPTYSSIWLHNSLSSSQYWYAAYLSDIANGYIVHKFEVRSYGSNIWFECVSVNVTVTEYQCSQGVPFSLPLSVRLTEINGENITSINLISQYSTGAVFLFGNNFGRNASPTNQPSNNPSESTMAPTSPTIDLYTTMSLGMTGQGNMFNLCALASRLEITRFDIHCDLGTLPVQVEVYVATIQNQTYFPIRLNASSWTMIHQETVSCNGLSILTYLSSFNLNSVPATINFGQCRGFYVTLVTNGLKYTIGNSAESVYVSDANLIFKQGIARDYAFRLNSGAAHDPRIWNGVISYHTISPYVNPTQTPTNSPASNPINLATYNPTIDPTRYTTNHEIILPDSAHIFIWSEENAGNQLTALYTVSKQLKTIEGFAINTNITCSFTYVLTKMHGVYPTKDRVDRYNVTLFADDDGRIDNYTTCNQNMSLIYDEHNELFITFTLPPILDAIYLDHSFGTILLTDDTWLHCHSFLLSQTAFHYDLNEHHKTNSLVKKNKLLTLMQYTGWHGAFHCAHRNYTDKLQITVDWIDTNTSDGIRGVYITLIDGDNFAYGDGFINLDNLHLNLYIVGWFQTTSMNYTNINTWNSTWNITWDYYITNLDEFEMVGFVSVFEEGWISYSGVLYRNDTLVDCTGFVFQSYIDVSIMDYSLQSQVQPTYNTSNNSESYTTTTTHDTTSIMDDTTDYNDDTDDSKSNDNLFHVNKDERIAFIVIIIILVLLVCLLTILLIYYIWFKTTKPKMKAQMQTAVEMEKLDH
eukprot:93990_1